MTGIRHTHLVAKRSVKSLHRTGRVSRKKARAVAKQLREDLESGEIKAVTRSKIRPRDTASGRGAISFHVVSVESRKPRRPPRARKAAGKAAS